jgi:hypothetical protein
MKIRRLAAAIAALSIGAGTDAAIPAGIASQLPPGYDVIATAHVAAGQPARSFDIVALARKDEGTLPPRAEDAPARPLLIFEQKGPHFMMAARNDQVVMKANEGGQCDPFLDGDATIAAKGRYFTVQNGVACGEHWTDYITFRLDDRAGGFVFDNERQEDWMINPSNDPNAEALVRAGPPRLIRDRPGHQTPFAAWRSTR